MRKDRLDIIYEDKELIVINKPAGLLTVSTENEKEKTLFHKVLVYLKRKHKANKVFIVHRLDKDTSGIVLFAKNEGLKRKLQLNWDELACSRKYMAVVDGNLEEGSGSITTWLKETKTLLVYSSNDKTNGKKATTVYKVINKNSRYSLVDISIKTGRKNQIRVHMSDLGVPVLGDKKYGSKIRVKRMMLHAYQLKITHPVTKKDMIFESKLPKEFNAYFEGNSNK